MCFLHDSLKKIFATLYRSDDTCKTLKLSKRKEY